MTRLVFESLTELGNAARGRQELKWKRPPAGSPDAADTRAIRLNGKRVIK